MWNDWNHLCLLCDFIAIKMTFVVKLMLNFFLKKLWKVLTSPRFKIFRIVQTLCICSHASVCYYSGAQVSKGISKSAEIKCLPRRNIQLWTVIHMPICHSICCGEERYCWSCEAVCMVMPWICETPSTTGVEETPSQPPLHGKEENMEAYREDGVHSSTKTRRPQNER